MTTLGYKVEKSNIRVGRFTIGNLLEMVRISHYVIGHRQATCDAVHVFGQHSQFPERLVAMILDCHTVNQTATFRLETINAILT